MLDRSCNGKLGKPAPFRKSTFSEEGGCCVEVAMAELIVLRDSKNPEGPLLWFTPEKWTAFLSGGVLGEFG